MARWEPNARERLVRAAVELFTEQGYDATTVTQIADRTGLTKTTFFRHFPDKREVLFAGQEAHTRLLAEAIAAAPGTATPLSAAAAGLDALAASFTEDRRELGARLKVLIADHAELRERAAYKHAVLVAATAGALRERGVPERTAAVAAEICMLAFSRAFDAWAGAGSAAGEGEGEGRTLVEYAREGLGELREVIGGLG